MTEMPVDVLMRRLDILRDSGGDYDHQAIALDIDEEFQEKFLFFSDAELSERSEQVEENRGWLHMGQGFAHLSIDENISVEDALTFAENALALYWYVKRTAEMKAEEEVKRAKRPAPGVYQACNQVSYFMVLVTEDQRIMVNAMDGGLKDCTPLWDENPGVWRLQRIDTGAGVVLP